MSLLCPPQVSWLQPTPTPSIAYSETKNYENSLKKKTFPTTQRHSEPCQISIMERYAKVVNS